MFTLRLTEEGKTEGHTLLMLKKRKGIFGWLCNRFVLLLGNILGQDFLKGDAKIFETIQFDLRTPIKTDQPIMQFINHLERQTALCWGTWQQVRLRDGEMRENRDKWRDALND